MHRILPQMLLYPLAILPFAPLTQLLFTGHSLGGAVASLAAAHMGMYLYVFYGECVNYVGVDSR